MHAVDLTSSYFVSAPSTVVNIEYTGFNCVDLVQLYGSVS